MRMSKTFFFMCMRKRDQGVYKINDYNVLSLMKAVDRALDSLEETEVETVEPM